MNHSAWRGSLVNRFAGDSLMAALDAGEQQRKKQLDTGSVLTATGTSTRAAARSFDETGTNAGFGQDTRMAPKYFDEFARALQRFNYDFG